MALGEVRGVERWFGSSQELDGIALDGASGSGTSTLPRWGA